MTDYELDILECFYRLCAPQMGIYNRGTKTVNTDHPHCKATLNKVQQIIRKGINPSRLKRLIGIYKKNGKSTVDILDVISDEDYQAASVEMEDNNLMSSSCHQHSELLEIIPEKRMMGFGNSGSILIKEAQTHIRMQYTPEDLYRYYSNKLRDGSEQDKKSDTGALVYLAQTFTLDSVLQSIDDALAEELTIRSPFDLKDLIIENEEHYKQLRGRTCIQQNN